MVAIKSIDLLMDKSIKLRVELAVSEGILSIFIVREREIFSTSKRDEREEVRTDGVARFDHVGQIPDDAINIPSFRVFLISSLLEFIFHFFHISHKSDFFLRFLAILMRTEKRFFVHFYCSN